MVGVYEMCKLISRQAAIDAINNLPDCPNGFSDTYDKSCIIGVLEQLPSAQPEQRWIPCSEREPDEDGQYIITVKYRHVDGRKDIYAEHGVLREGVIWDVYYFGHCDEVERVLAWMPLPEPYKE